MFPRDRVARSLKAASLPAIRIWGVLDAALVAVISMWTVLEFYDAGNCVK